MTVINQTIEKLCMMKLGGMARAIEEQLAQASSLGLTFEERISAIVDREYLERENKKLTRRLKMARFKQQADFESIDYRHPRALDKSSFLSLGNCEWVRRHQNVILTGPTGVGKSFLAEALANKACRLGYTALLYKSQTLFRDLQTGKADGSFARLFKRLGKVDVLVVDDFLISGMVESERRDFLEIMEEKYDHSSVVLTSQYSIAQWHDLIGGPTLADAILDRIVHNSHAIELEGDSMRKIKAITAKKK